MPLPIFVIPLAIALAGGGGAVAATFGGLKLRKAERMIREAEKSQGPHLKSLLVELDASRADLAGYGELKLALNAGNLQRLRDYVTNNGRRVDPSMLGVLDDLRLDLPNVDDPETIRVARDLLGATVGSVVSGAAARSAILALVSAYGTASTGAPIATLTGAAAANAIFAFLGGGALAAGGGGVAAGGLVLGAVGVAPGVLIAGLTLLIKGEKRLTVAREFEARVAVHNATLDALCEEQPAIRARTNELSIVATTLDGLLGKAVDALQGLPLDDAETHSSFWRAILIATTLTKLLAVPVLTPDGFVNTDTVDHIRQAKHFTDAGGDEGSLAVAA